MPKRTKEALSDFDKLINAQIAKSVVTAPSDPTGGAKLPVDQEDKPRRKGKGKTQYMAVFDRDANESDDQLDDWLDDTQEATDSPDDFVGDARDDDAPEDADDEDYEDNHGDIYDPYGDDDEFDSDDLESLELPDDDNEYVKVRGHKRRKIKKSNEAARGDMDEDFADLTNDDDDLDEDDDDDEDDNKKRKSSKKDDEKVEKSMARRKKIRKALGADAMKYVDGSEFVKSLTDAVLDFKEEVQSEIRALRVENRKLTRQLAVLTKRENREMAKSLFAGQMQLAGYAPVVEPQTEQEVPTQQRGQAVRKSVGAGYGATPRTSQRVGEKLPDVPKILDALEKGLSTSDNPNLIINDIAMLENDGRGAIQFLSSTSQDVLRKENLL